MIELTLFNNGFKQKYKGPVAKYAGLASYSQRPIRCQASRVDTDGAAIRLHDGRIMTAKRGDWIIFNEFGCAYFTTEEVAKQILTRD